MFLSISSTQKGKAHEIACCAHIWKKCVNQNRNNICCFCFVVCYSSLPAGAARNRCLFVFEIKFTFKLKIHASQTSISPVNFILLLIFCTPVFLFLFFITIITFNWFPLSGCGICCLEVLADHDCETQTKQGAQSKI